MSLLELNDLLATIDSYIGGSAWFVYLLLGTGLFFTIYLGFPQIRYFRQAWRIVMGKFDQPEAVGDTSHFQSLATALSGTVGTGNIAGVAFAIHLGGPAALFWMLVTAGLGMTTKFVEVTLSHKYREFAEDGTASGGPMYYMKNKLNMKWMAVLFAIATIISSFGTGNMPQVNSIASSLEATFGVSPIVTGAVLSVLLGLIILGGIKRIAATTSKLVPAMAIIYFIGVISVIGFNYENIIPAFLSIFSDVFSGSAAVGGFLGASLAFAFNRGVNRGLFSNEAGQGSAAIAHSTAKTKFAIREGSVAMLGPFIDTIMICSLTGLVIISTGAWHHTEFYVSRIDPNFTGELMNSSILTSFAFKQGLSWLFEYGDKIVTLAVLLFAISTAISWSYYGDRSANYLFGKKATVPYKWVYVLFVFIGAIAQLEAVWAFGDAALGFMTFPNLLSIILLSGVLKKMSKDYFSVKHIEYKKLLEQDNKK